LLPKVSSGLYYKHITIVNNDYRRHLRLSKCFYNTGYRTMKMTITMKRGMIHSKSNKVSLVKTPVTVANSGYNLIGSLGVAILFVVAQPKEPR
jgi:hypothetical protein